MSRLISFVSVVGMSSLFFIGANRADPMPGENERQGRSTNIFFFHEGPLQGHDLANTRQTLDAGEAFNYEAQLFRLETYKDKYGRTICKRVVRFVRTRTGRNIGEVTPELAEALMRRPGKGRTAEARAEAERNRLLAESLAKRLLRAKASWRRSAAGKSRRGRQARHSADAFGSELLPDVS